MIRRSALVAVAASTVFLSTVFLSTAGPVAASLSSRRADATYLQLDSASPWVDSEGTWTATWSVVAEPPADATLDYTIHQSIPGSGTTLRAGLSAILGGGPSGPILQSRVSTPLAQLRSGSTVTLSLPIRSRSGGADRILMPNAGVHPVDVALSSSDGSALQTDTLFIDHLPATSNRPALKVGPMIAVRSAPVLANDGTVAVPAAATSAAADAAAVLGAAGPVAVSTLIDPELLAATTTPTPPTGADTSTTSSTTSSSTTVPPESGTGALERLRAAAAAAGVPAIRASWVPLDMEGWATSGTLADIQAATTAGQETTAQVLGHGAEISVWPTDATIGPASIPALHSMGVEHLIVNPDRLVSRTDLGGDAGSTRTFRIESADSGIDALALDPTLTIRLHDTSLPAGEAASRVLTELAAIWFSTPSGVTPAVVLDLTGVPVDVATRVLAGLATPTTAITLTDLPGLFAGTTASQVGKRKDPLVRRLQPTRGSHDVGALSTQLGILRTRVTAHRSTMGVTADSDLLARLLLTAQHRDLDTAAARRYGDAVAGRVATDFAHISTPPVRTVPVTARRATLPVLINNATGHTVSVQLRFRGSRFEFTQGAIRALDLRPGSNALEIPVLARTSGDLPLVVDVRTADGAVVITQTRLRVHSTVVSGVGIVLGGGALGFLVLWWGATIRRDRRAKKETRTEGDASIA